FLCLHLSLCLSLLHSAPYSLSLHDALPICFLIIGERAAPEGEAGQAWVVAAVVKHGLKWTPAGASGDFRGRCGVFFRKGLLLVVLWGIIGASHRHHSCRWTGFPGVSAWGAPPGA